MLPFFRKKPAPVAEIPQETPQSVSQISPVFDVRAIVRSDVGCVRETNEDNAQFFDSDWPSHGVLAIVADGMGGHAAGEVASQIAVETVSKLYFESQSPPPDALRTALESANSAIFEAARRDASKRGMGTTCVVLVVRGNEAFCAHVGDSRLYLVRQNEIYQMTQDHSAVAELVKRGLLSAQEARTHPQKNVILRAMGTQAHIEVEVWDEPFETRAGDCWILCSDGLSDLVENSEICRAVTQSGENAPDVLVALARKGGGHDNISVICVQIRDLAPQTPQNGETCDAMIPKVAGATREVEIP